MDIYNCNPLYVDLDGTFTKSDLLFENLVVALKSNPFIIFLCIPWLLKGRSYLKHKLSEHADIKTELLPLNAEFFSFLCEERRKNRKIILATASNEKYAESVCRNFDLFDSYISSDKENNLKGQTKLDKIKSLSSKYSYAGNSSEDFILFEQAEESYLVNPTPRAKKMLARAKISQLFDVRNFDLKTWLKQLRIHQWLKNLLILVLLLVSGNFLNIDLLLLSSLGFISFSCLASATYIVNDLLDLEADRSHPRKKFRPLAAGEISIANAKIIALALFTFAFLVGISFSISFTLVLIAYLALTLLYSFKIKQYVGLDVVALTTLYTIRIIAGAAILNVTVSFWLFAFSMFVFLSLALVKRCAELKSHEEQEKIRLKGRDYNIYDYPVLMSLGMSSAMLSVLMFCFYVNNNVLTNQYQEPTLLWMVVPALGYWMMRMWIKTNRGEMHDDPIVFSLKDRGSIATIVFIGVIAVAAQVL
ncbi:UbiA family prenyltransferase [Aliikangiella coralliicola]|uniref:UbiA family prenyltransferase n=1 Tax=Aliikangiella coralliicola TaxID=2592383 RepID=A0A545UHF1_9GAMM|nr:UbiA family prenyltransferase [Aliikangiella coralliicola]TQV88897.1 UbiA family prenyltransferase [Aliikangiella coralliicola]